MKKMPLLLAAALLAVLAAAPASADEKKSVTPSEPEKNSESKMTKTPSGLQYEDIEGRHGRHAAKGPDLRHALHGMALGERRERQEVR